MESPRRPSSTAGSPVGPELARLIELLARLPGLGPRSARRAALHLAKRREALLAPLAEAMAAAAAKIRPCAICGHVDTAEICSICADPQRDDGLLCVVEDSADLWAIERMGGFQGRYHVLGGALSALDGIGPEELRIPQLLARAAEVKPREAILALNATVDGRATAHYLAEAFADLGIKASFLAQGVPMGGELEHLDEGTIAAAFMARRAL